MIDEGFHLTALDVRRYDFGSKLRGADPAKVEEFRSQVAEEIERLTRLGQEMESKARGFHEQLRAFRDRDKALNDALISAQQLRSEIREQAERESQLILREARAEGEKMVEAARGEVRRIEMELAALEKSRRSFIGQLRALAERHLSDLAASESAPPSRLGAGSENEGNRPDGLSRDSGSRPAAKTPAWLESLVKE